MKKIDLTEEHLLGHGAIHSPELKKDKKVLRICSSEPFDWLTGWDFEKKYGIKIPFKNQQNSQSCGGQAGSYATAVAEIVSEQDKNYIEDSAKALYSQIFMPNGGGCTEIDLIKLLTNWGCLVESLVPSHKSDGTTDESFMEDKSWINDKMNEMAKSMKIYQPAIVENTMEAWAQAIRDHGFLIVAVQGSNNGTWNSNEPKPPTKPTWGHFLCFMKAGTDSSGKFVSTPNSWGDCRSHDLLHSDGWQKFRQNWFDSGMIWTAYTFHELKTNNNTMTFRLITMEGDANRTVFWVGNDQVRRPFMTASQYTQMCAALGFDSMFTGLETLTKEQMMAIPEGKPLVIIQ
jgi:hypothetical protein